jgi:hypothetical protein
MRDAPRLQHDRRYADTPGPALQGTPDASAADGRSTYIRLISCGRLVEPPHCVAAERNVVEIGDQECAFACHYLRVAQREMRGAWFGKCRRQLRIQCRDQPHRVRGGQCCGEYVRSPRLKSVPLEPPGSNAPTSNPRQKVKSGATHPTPGWTPGRFPLGEPSIRSPEQPA